MHRESDTRDNTKRAYDKGCMWGMSGRDESQCPYAPGDALEDWWLAGWREGHDAFLKRHPPPQHR